MTPDNILQWVLAHSVSNQSTSRAAEARWREMVRHLWEGPLLIQHRLDKCMWCLTAGSRYIACSALMSHRDSGAGHYWGAYSAPDTFDASCKSRLCNRLHKKLPPHNFAPCLRCANMRRFPKRLGFPIKIYRVFLYPHVCLMSLSADPPCATCFGVAHFRHGRYCQK